MNKPNLTKRPGEVSLLSSTIAWLIFALAAFTPPNARADEQAASFQTYTLKRARAGAVEPVVRQTLSALNEKTEIAVDAQGNRLLIRGSDEAQQLAKDLIRSLDRANAPPPRGKPVLKTYPYPGDDAAQVAARVQSRFKAEQGVRIAADPRTGQILVVAPPETQAEIAQQLGEHRPRPADGGNAATEAAPAPPTTLAPPRPFNVQLKHASTADVERRLKDLWRGRLAPLAQTNPDTAAFVVRSTDGQLPLELQINRRTREAAVRGPEQAVASCIKLLEALDQPSATSDEETRVIPLRAATAGYVRRALAPVDENSPAAQRAQTGKPSAALRLASRIFQPSDQDADAAAPADGRAGRPAGPAALNPALGPADMADDDDRALQGTVEIEQLPGLDAIIIRGSDRDVQRVMEIIEDIERLSAEAEPSVEVYYLKHVDSQTMLDVVEPIYGTHFAPHRGAVAITALVKPNALLLIGREESIRGAVDLITRLDLPADPTTQFKVYRLKHASAATVSNTVSQFFASRGGGLAGDVNVTVDARSNSLIVQAGPRDLVEVSQLIRRIDTPTSAAVNEMRIFPLRNTPAEELAPILQAAVTGQTAPGGAPAAPGAQGGGAQAQRGGQRGQQEAPGAPVQTGIPAAAGTGVAGGGAATTAQEAKSLMLKLMTVDADGQRQISSGILSDVRITANPRSNSLIVSAPAENMELIATLIRQLDQSNQAPAQIKVFTVKNGDASSMTDMLIELFGGAAAAAPAGGGQGGGPGGGAMMQGPPSGQEGAVAPLQFSVDPRTNSIIAAGSAPDLAVVEAILLRLDESDIRERQSTVYRLKNAPALDVAIAINDFLRTERQFQQTQPGLVSPFEQIEQEVVVVPEIVSNSLIVSATPRFYDEIERIVEQLDARPPMVMIQVLIAQVTLVGTDEFGIEVGLQNSVMFDRSVVGNLTTITTSNTQSVAGGGTIATQTTPIVGASLTPGYDFNNPGLTVLNSSGQSTQVGLSLPNSGATSSLATASQLGGQGLSNFGLGRINQELGYGGLVLSASSDAVNVLLRALRERRRLEVLSRPQIMTLDNQPAYIQVGQRVPVLSGSTVGVVGQTSNVQYQNVGLIVAVTPRISPDGMVVMEIDAEKSQLGPITEGIPVGFGQNGAVLRQPRIDITQAQTTISAMDSQTVVFGGMITQSDQIIQRRVPGISEIPLLGRLFRYDYNQTQRNELLIIMTPHVVRNEMQAESLKQQEASRMSWCLADVQKVHGDAGLRGRGDVWADDETMTIYPDADPAGEQPFDAEQLPPPSPTGPLRNAPPQNALPPNAAPPNSLPPNGPMLETDPAARRNPRPAAPREAQPRRSSRPVQSTAAGRPPLHALPPRSAPRPAAGELKLHPAAQNRQNRPPQNRVVPAEYRAAPPPGYDPRYAPPGQVQPVIYDAPIDQQRYRR